MLEETKQRKEKHSPKITLILLSCKGCMATIPTDSSNSCTETKGCFKEGFSLQLLSRLKGWPSVAAILRYQKHQILCGVRSLFT